MSPILSIISNFNISKVVISKFIISIVAVSTYKWPNKAIAFAPSASRPFQPNLMSAGKAMSLSKSGAPKRCFTWVGSGLAHQHQTGLERLAKGQTF
jgi:hypothetical protein